MADTLRARRLKNEWSLLLQLVAVNPEQITNPSRRIAGEADEFSFTLNQTPALIQDYTGLQEQSLHQIRFVFPRFYPAVSVEAYLDRAVFHPNVHPQNGFVCLWNRFAPGDSTLEAIRQLQRVITWTLFNREALHLMQPDALNWYMNGQIEIILPMPYKPVAAPAGGEQGVTFEPAAPIRRRLSRD